MTTEKPIPRTMNKYFATKFGEIISYAKGSRRILKPSISHGYPQVVITLNNERMTRKVHRLVLSAFQGESILECNHIDGNRKNNCIENLEYCTRSYNQKHAYKINPEYAKKFQGDRNPISKLTSTNVKEIRKSYPSISRAELARKFGISWQQVNHIIKRVQWRHI